MSTRKFLCPSDSLREGHYIELQEISSRGPLFLVGTRYQGAARVWLNCCPHQGRALNWAPNQFLVDPSGQLVCAAHGAVFEPSDGRCISGPCLKASLTPVEVSEQDGQVYLVSG